MVDSVMQTKPLVSKGMRIGDVVEQYPMAADVMAGYGLHCIGCDANPYDSIEAGAKVHGMSAEMMEQMLDDVNEAIAHYKEPTGEVSLTERAAKKVLELMKSEQKDGSGLRVGVVAGGCSGYQYLLDFESAPTENDAVVEQHGLKLFIDSASHSMLKGVRIDYVDGLQGAGFKIENPNAKHECGCGKSFG